jgi:hypothetical protein
MYPIKKAKWCGEAGHRRKVTGEMSGGERHQIDEVNLFADTAF